MYILVLAVHVALTTLSSRWVYRKTIVISCHDRLCDITACVVIFLFFYSGTVVVIVVAVCFCLSIEWCLSFIVYLSIDCLSVICCLFFRSFIRSLLVCYNIYTIVMYLNSNKFGCTFSSSLSLSVTLFSNKEDNIGHTSTVTQILQLN